MVSDQFDHELQQLILAINKVSGSQKWRACAGAGAGKKITRRGREMATRVESARMGLAARAGGIGPA